MISACIYERNSQNTPVNTAFAQAFPGIHSSSAVKVTHKGTDTSIVLTVQDHSDIEAGDFVADPWVLDFLNAKPADRVSIEPIFVRSQISGREVELTFVAFQSQVNWDEVPQVGPMKIPYMWSSLWPEGCNLKALERNASMLLSGCVLCSGTLCCLRVLDSLMVFRVTISGTDDDTILASALCTYRIVKEHLNSQTSSQTMLANIVSVPLCFSPTISGLMDLCGGIFSPQSRPRGFVKSAVLSAPAGGGKSTLLNTVANLCNSQFGSKHCDVTVLRGSCKGIDQKLQHQGDGGSTATEGDAHPAHDEWMSSLLKVLRLLDIDYPAEKQSPTSSILLCIDDVDCIFSNYSARKDDNLEQGRSAEIFQLLGYHLSRLLKNIASPHCEARVLVLGCTRRDGSQLLRAHTGCPEFEKCISVCSPTYQERLLILEKLLVDSGLVFSDCRERDLEERVGQNWAARLAGLTAGYLPGDLSVVVQRIVFLHRGKQAARQHRHQQKKKDRDEIIDRDDGPEDTADEEVSWSTALEAVVSVVPLQLQQLGVQANSAKQSSGSARLCWSDFAGYSSLVADLKRRLIPKISQESLDSPRSKPLSSDVASGSSCAPDMGEAVKTVKTLQGSAPRGIVLHGPSGCGKTLLASVITSELKMNFVSVRSTDLLSKYFGETENTIRELFQRARSAAPCVLFFDDFDTLAHKRSAADEGDHASSSGLHGRILSTFLNELDGIVSSGGGSGDLGSQQVLVIAACQDIQQLDEALVRPGRLQHHVLLHQPAEADIEAILQLYASKLACAPDVSLDEANSVLCALKASASEVECYARNAFMYAIRERVQLIEQPQYSATANLTSLTSPEDYQVRQCHFDLALRDLMGQRGEPIEVNTVNTPAVADEAKSSFEWSGDFSFGV